jgi:acetoacetyl-CoA synthetase
VKGIPSIEKLMVACYTDDEPDISYIPGFVHYGDFLSTERGLEIQFERSPFDHPVYIVFSSGRAPRKEEQIWQGE